MNASGADKSTRHTQKKQKLDGQIYEVAKCGHTPHPGLGPCVLLWENREPVIDIFLEPGKVLDRALTCFPAMVWAAKASPIPWWSMAQPVVLSKPSPSLAPRLLLYLALGVMPSGEDFFQVMAGRN